MTILKKSKAIIAAILVAVTLFVCAAPVYAAETIEKKKTFLCPVAVATCKLTSNSKRHANAITTVSSDRDEICAYVLGNVYNSKYDHVEYKSDTAVAIKKDPSTPNKSSGNATITLDSSSSNYFKSIASTHIVVQKSVEYGGIVLDIQY